MNPSYKKEKDNDYMILEAPGKPEGSEYQIRMLLVNQISGLLSCKMRKVDGITAFYYDITEKQPMTRAFERQQMGKQDIEKLLRGLEKAMDESGRYLLAMEQFVLKPDYIFRNVDTGEFSFCYLPFYDGSLEEDFRELAEYILKRLDHSQEEAVLWGYDIYSRSVEEHFSMGKILESAHKRAGREAVKQNQEQETDVDEPEYRDLEEMEELPLSSGQIDPERKKESAKNQENEPPERKEGEKERAVQRGTGIEETNGTKQKDRKEADRESQRERWRTQKKKTKTGKNRGLHFVQVRAEVRGRFGRILLVLFGMLGSLAAAVWAVLCQGLNFIQAGGILVLCMGLLVYFTTVFQKKPKKKESRLEEEISQWELSGEEESDRTVFLGTALPESFPVLVSMDPVRQGNVVLDKTKMTVGKQKDQADIFLTDASVSRVHAIIEKEKDDWYVKDLGSTNGTFVNEERLRDGEKRKLEDGTELRFSNLRFYFHQGDAERR